MINIEAFIKRLEQILEYYSISASVFADRIGVQRSGLSHLLSGRNKPSLDFVMRIVDNFPDVDLYWLLNGKGTFPKSENVVTSVNTSPTEDFSEERIKKNYDLFSEEKAAEENNVTKNTETINKIRETPHSEDKSNDIEQIVVFYVNGSFRIYKP